MAQTLSPKAPPVFAAGGWESFRSFESWVYLNGGRSGGEPEVGQVLHKGKNRAPGVEHYVLDTSLDEVYFALE